MNFDYFDNMLSSNAPSIDSPEQIRDEMSQLKDIADKIGSYRWNYKEDFNAAPDNEEHIGIVAQQLLQVPGLEAAVNQDPNTGVLTVDTQYVALAALGLVSALARYVLNNDKEIANGNDKSELLGEIPEAGGTEAGATEDEAMAEQASPETAADAESTGIDDVSQLGSV